MVLFLSGGEDALLSEVAAERNYLEEIHDLTSSRDKQDRLALEERRQGELQVVLRPHGEKEREKETRRIQVASFPSKAFVFAVCMKCAG